MTDHAYIVRNESAWLADYADYGARATEDQGVFVDGDADSHRANLIAALDALVAENDDEMEAQMEYWKSKAKAAEAEVEAADARHEKIWQRAKAAEAEVARLREVLTVYAGRTNDYEVARAALGEDA